MKTFCTIAELKQALAAASDIGFVPTMGALHAGHLSLVAQARKHHATVVVSLFVNPTQFNDPNDLKHYPRTLEADLKSLEAAGVDCVFTPSVEEIYPEPDTRMFDFGMLDKVMEGATRPGHFNGVAQVVSRLFDIVRPTHAYFGEKDFQQIAIVREMVRQLDLPVEIVACPIVRDTDGLALSSRNTLLTPAHRKAAPLIYKALRTAAEGKNLSPDRVIADVEASPLLKVIYFQIVDGRTLQPVSTWNDAPHIQACIAVQAGNVRLIDNIRLK